MNGHETRALHDMGREAWNEWAAQIVKSKANFEQAGIFSLDWFGEAGNEETRIWLKTAAADFSDGLFEERDHFRGFHFSRPGDLEGGGVPPPGLVRRSGIQA